jgi:hypothetical protein
MLIHDMTILEADYSPKNAATGNQNRQYLIQNHHEAHSDFYYM